MKNYVTKNWIIISVLLIIIIFAIFLLLRVNELEQELSRYTLIDGLNEMIPDVSKPFGEIQPQSTIYDKDGNSWDSSYYTTQKPYDY